jgi:hypothetical protein
VDLIDPRADIDDVLQDVPDPAAMMPAPVQQQGPIDVRQLPRDDGGAFSVQVTSQPRRVLTADPRRASAVLMPRSQDIYWGRSPAQCSGGYAAWWPVGVRLDIEHTGEVWVATGAGLTTDVTVSTTQWTG